MQPLHREEALSTFPIFLLEVYWDGNIYRFSSFPIDVFSGSGESVYFGGGLSDPELEIKMEAIQSDPESGSIAIEVVFPVDLVKKYIKEGKSLDSATAELSMVMEMDGMLSQPYEDRIKLFSGVIIQPIIGDPEMPVGYATFSIERNPLNTPKTFIPATWRITTDAYISSVDIGNVSNGKVTPFVFGDPHDYNNETDEIDLYVSPAYIVDRKRSSFSTTDPRADTIHLLIAGHEVVSTAVKIIDYAGNTDQLPVFTASNLKGQVYSYVIFRAFDYSSGTFTPRNNLVNPWMDGYETSTPKYYISWSIKGGFPNPFGSGFLEGAGDIIRYMLSVSGVEVDLSSWNNISTYLNAFKFAGYINDPEITSYEFIMENIIPYIPVEIVNGYNGLRGIVPLYYDGLYVNPRVDLKLNHGVYLVSPFEPIGDSSDIINRLVLNYAYDGVNDNTPARFEIRGSIEPDEYTFQTSNNSTALASYNRYSDRYAEKTVHFVYEARTINKIATYIIRRNAFLKVSLMLQLDIQYGWLEVGDIVSLTSTDLYMDEIRVQIISKKYADNSWLVGVLLEDNVSMRIRR